MMSDNNTDDAILGDGNIDNTVTGETSAEDVPSPLLYGRKTTDPSKVKTSKRLILGSSLQSLQQMTHLLIKVLQQQRRVMHLIQLTCEYMNFLFKAHQTQRT